MICMPMGCAHALVACAVQFPSAFNEHRLDVARRLEEIRSLAEQDNLSIGRGHDAPPKPRAHPRPAPHTDLPASPGPAGNGGIGAEDMTFAA